MSPPAVKASEVSVSVIVCSACSPPERVKTRLIGGLWTLFGDDKNVFLAMTKTFFCGPKSGKIRDIRIQPGWM